MGEGEAVDRDVVEARHVALADQRLGEDAAVGSASGRRSLATTFWMRRSSSASASPAGRRSRSWAKQSSKGGAGIPCSLCKYAWAIVP